MERVEYDLRSNKGGTIYMPPWCEGQEGWGNLLVPNVHDADTIQQYPVGTKFAEGDRVFRYAKLGAEDGVYLGHAGYGLKTLSIYYELQNLILAAAAGVTVLEITATATLNQYAGGYIGIEDPVSGLRASHRIISNTVTVGGTAFFTLAHPIAAAVGVTGDVVLCENPYASVNRGSGGGTILAGIVGVQVPHAPSAGNWIWIQTWGTCPMMPASGSFEGGGQAERTAYFMGDGAIQIPASGVEADTEVSGFNPSSLQVAGWLMPQNTFGEDQDYAVLCLTIAP